MKFSLTIFAILNNSKLILTFFPSSKFSKLVESILNEYNRCCLTSYNFSQALNILFFFWSSSNERDIS